MTVRITRVWHAHDRRVTPPRFRFANVIAKDARGVEHLLITFDAAMASRCLQYERKSSTSELQPPAVDLSFDARGKITSLREVAA